MKNSNPYFDKLGITLDRVRNAGIANRLQLNNSRNDALREELWTAMEDFIRYCALPARHGTAAVLKESLLECTDGMVNELLTKVISELDHVLAQEPAKQIPYILSMVYHHLYGGKKKAEKAPEANSQPLNTPVDEEGTEIIDLIPGYDSIEEEIEGRERFLEMVAALADHPAELFIHLAMHRLDMKPREIRELLNRKGAAGSFVSILLEAAEKYRIPVSMIRDCLAGRSFRKEGLADLDTANTAELSRIRYRAGTRLIKAFNLHP